MTLIGLPENKDTREVWVSGSEIIRHTDELIDGSKQDERATGRTSRLACKYAELALQYPNCRVIIKDHFDKLDADRQLARLVCKILDLLNIDWEAGQLDQVVRDPHSFTGTTKTGQVVFIKAKPKIRE